MPDRNMKFDRNYQGYVNGLSRLTPLKPGQNFVRQYSIKGLKLADGTILADLQEVVNMPGLKFLKGMLAGAEIVSIQGQIIFDTIVKVEDDAGD